MPSTDLLTDLLEALEPGRAPEEIARRQSALLLARQGAEQSSLDDDVARLVQALAEPARGLVARGLAALTAGSLVEGGASPGPLGRALLERLPDVLGPAARFHETCAKLAPEDEDPDGGAEVLEVGGTLVPTELVQGAARGDPEGALAWQALEYWSLPAIACLTRDPDLRARARARPALRNLACEAVGYTGFLTVALDLLDDALLLVLHPGAQKGYEARISCVPSNFDLHVLLADAIVRDGVAGPPNGLVGQRPSAAAVRATRGHLTTEETRCEGQWNMYDAFALAPDGSLPEHVDTERWVWNEGRPADIPVVEGRRVVLLGPPSYVRTWTAQATFGGLEPELVVERTLSPEEVEAWCERLAPLEPEAGATAS